MSTPRHGLFSAAGRRVATLWLTLGLAALIACLTLLPLDVSAGVPGSDKTHHVLAFVGLLLPAATLYPKALLRVVLAAALFGAAIEILQPYVGRSGELADFIADLTGIALGAALGTLMRVAVKAFRDQPDS